MSRFTISTTEAPSALDAAYFAAQHSQSRVNAGGSSGGRRSSRLRDRLEDAWGPIRARYDAAQTTDENSNHWVHADSLSARAANTHAIRATLRKRARYEAANNSYLKGMVKTYANEVI